MARPPKDLRFSVSTGLKTVLGRELITDDAVAIFEMVKNSFDASAVAVHLYFDSSRIMVADNGSGMSLDDLQTKWLFVAYSAKRIRPNDDYRDAIAARPHLAGNKGIGRFSSDRLGERLTLQTRPARSNEPIHVLSVDWQLFEKDDTQTFSDIPVSYRSTEHFAAPPQLSRFVKTLTHGTIIEITQLRHQWSRADLQSLKSALSKLINPFGPEADKFTITVTAPNEVDADKRALQTAKSDGATLSSRVVVNGKVGNFIFSELQEKTTFLTVSIENGKLLSTLVDRGEIVYKIREENPYGLLASSGFRAEIYYLNHSAKLTFARRVGVPSVQFGSIFLFRNGFRIFPIGEEQDDWFGYNRRKQQGYSRFLGSRELIGRVDIFGGLGDFEEASSRNQGLIDSPAVRELKSCVMEHCIKRLEKYVVPVSWADRGDANAEDISRLLTDPGRARVSAAIASLIDNTDIELLDYSKKLVTLLNERSEGFEQSIVSLRAIGEKTRDTRLLDTIAVAERRFEELKKSEAEARQIADRERAAAVRATERAQRAEQEVDRARSSAAIERRRSLFLDNVSSIEVKQLLSLQHQVTLYSVEVNQQIENLLVNTATLKSIPRESLLKALEQIVFLNRRIQAVSRFAATANFELDSGKIDADFAAYIVDYIQKVATVSGSNRTRIEVSSPGFEFPLRFNPMDAAIIVDNLVSNAKKARATRLTFKIDQPDRATLRLIVSDNGSGLVKGVDPDQMFNIGYSTTDGSGLGLYHVKQILGSLNGTIQLSSEQPQSGLSLEIMIARRGK